MKLGDKGSTLNAEYLNPQGQTDLVDSSNYSTWTTDDPPVRRHGDSVVPPFHHVYAHASRQINNHQTTGPEATTSCWR